MSTEYTAPWMAAASSEARKATVFATPPGSINPLGEADFMTRSKSTPSGNAKFVTCGVIIPPGQTALIRSGVPLRRCGNAARER